MQLSLIFESRLYIIKLKVCYVACTSDFTPIMWKWVACDIDNWLVTPSQTQSIGVKPNFVNTNQNLNCKRTTNTYPRNFSVGYTAIISKLGYKQVKICDIYTNIQDRNIHAHNICSIYIEIIMVHMYPFSHLHSCQPAQLVILNGGGFSRWACPLKLKKMAHMHRNGK